MDYKEFWGNTPDCCVYDITVLLSYPHEYMNVDRNSKAWALLHELFMQGLPFDPFHTVDDNSDC